MKDHDVEPYAWSPPERSWSDHILRRDQMTLGWEMVSDDDLVCEGWEPLYLEPTSLARELAVAQERASDEGLRALKYLDELNRQIDATNAANASVLKFESLWLRELDKLDRLREGLLEIKSNVETYPLDDTETCMCGSPVAGHNVGSGHAPVSNADHALSLVVEAIEKALRVVSISEKGDDE